MMDINVYTKNKNSINIFFILTIFKILWFICIVTDRLFHIKWNCAHETKQSSSPYHPWILLEQTWQLFQLDLHVLSKFAYTFLSYIFKKISDMNFGFGVIWTFGFFFSKILWHFETHCFYSVQTDHANMLLHFFSALMATLLYNTMVSSMCKKNVGRVLLFPGYFWNKNI